MKLRTVSPQWFNDEYPDKEARCVSFPATKEQDPWYPEEDVEESYKEAKDICLGTYSTPCPLKDQCLEFALSNNERYGIWGGMSPEERANLRKERRLQRQWERVGVLN
jgi:hypothetical protein